MLIKPAEVRSRKKQRKLGTEVADLKQKLSQSNKNIVLSNREIRLLRLVNQKNAEIERKKKTPNAKFINHFKSQIFRPN